MPEFLLLMHGDVAEAESNAQWARYFDQLHAAGAFAGGSAIGPGEALRKHGTAADISHHITGYIKIVADDLAAARALVAGNPVYECGGTVEIRALLED